MMRSRIPVCLGSVYTAVLLSMSLTAADVKQTSMASAVDSPSIGYVVRTPDPSTGVPELRAMLGVPGAARFSDPIALPDGTSMADVSTSQKWILVVRAGEVLAFQPDTATATSVTRLGAPASWAFSPSGSRLALSYPDRGNVVLISGLPASPKLENTLRIAQMDAFAVSDNGAFVYTSGGQTLTADGGVVYQAGGPLAFEPGQDVVVLYDSANTNLMEVSASGGASRIIASGLAAPDQLFAGVDRIYAGISGAGTISLIEYADGSTATQNVKLSRIAPSSITGTVLVSFDTNDPAWLVSAQGVSFVPAILASQQGVQ